MSEQFTRIGLSSITFAKKTREIGRSGKGIHNFYREFKVGSDNILFNETDLFSNSGKMRFSLKGKTKKGND